MKNFCSVADPAGLPDGSVVKNLPVNTGDVSVILGSGRFPREGNGNLLPYSCLENPMDREAWWATVHEVKRVRHDLATKPPPQYPFTENPTVDKCGGIFDNRCYF